MANINPSKKLGRNFFYRTSACFLVEGSGNGIRPGRRHKTTDLLHEIDTALNFGKGFLLGEGAFLI